VSAPAKLLVQAADPRIVQVFRSALLYEPQTRLLSTAYEGHTAGLIREERPDLVVIECAPEPASALALCIRLRALPEMENALLVLAAPPVDDDLRLAGLESGIDGYLDLPVTPAGALSFVRLMLRLRRSLELLSSDREELERLHDAQRSGFEHMLSLLVTLLDLRIPGSAERGHRVASLAARVAARFEVPAELMRELEIGARLHEMGRVVVDAARSGIGDGEASVGNWHYVHSTRAILRQVDGLEDAAELVGAIYENWDGTGGPEHRIQGQIPLRSRILRATIDYLATLDGPGDTSRGEVLGRMDEHAGTLYDPMVIVHLRAVLLGADDLDSRAQELRVPVMELRAGMVLAQDLCTDSGLKLLARGTMLTSSTLELIMKRHNLEPILVGAAIRRAAA
jgi:response regulator RpfG family c-di-GMP phosphodiesterase